MFKKGDVVKIKSWDQLVHEFGLDSQGIIKCNRTFTEDMSKFCGRVYMLINDESDKGDVYFDAEPEEEVMRWYWSSDMVEIVKARNENTDIKLKLLNQLIQAAFKSDIPKIQEALNILK